MALRSFTDSVGNVWQAFDVVPRPDERRRYDRRGREMEADSANSKGRGGQRTRRDDDRRVSVGRRSTMAKGVVDGWLCFERDDATDRRRLTPIPQDWRRCSEEVLEGYCRSALPTRRPSGEEPAARKR